VLGKRTQQDLFGYEVLERIPGSGMSECFKVRADGAIRFLKKVPISGIYADALRRELDVYQKLERGSAVNVLRIHDYKRDGDFLALVTEFADGGTLAEHVEPPDALDHAEARTVAMSLLNGLRELHSLQVVHRDLKPQNVLRVGQQWKLCDFGISKNLSRLVTQGRTFQRVGTSGYAPPEQWHGTEAHPSADVYAFGKLLVFLLTAQTDIDLLYPDDVPSWGRLARRCTAFVPEARPSLDQIEAELARL
jgi:serine/threonine protein kinase